MEQEDEKKVHTIKWQLCMAFLSVFIGKHSSREEKKRMFLIFFMSLSISNLIWIFNIPSNKHFSLFFFSRQTYIYTHEEVLVHLKKIYIIHTTVNRIASSKGKKIKELCIKNSITNDGNDEIFDEAQVVIFFTTSYQ